MKKLETEKQRTKLFLVFLKNEDALFCRNIFNISPNRVSSEIVERPPTKGGHIQINVFIDTDMLIIYLRIYRLRK